MSDEWLKGQLLHVVAVLDIALNNETVRSNFGRRRRRPKEIMFIWYYTVSSSSIGDTVNTVFSCESYSLFYYYCLPAASFRQSLPAGACGRLSFGTNGLLLTDGDSTLSNFG